MPNRILKESICRSDTIDQLTAFQETFFYRLIVNCDDYGRFDARIRILKNTLYPLKDMRETQIEDALKALASAELVILYEVHGKPFLQIATWQDHQSIRAKTSKYPEPEGACKRLLPDKSRCMQMKADESRCMQMCSLSYSYSGIEDDNAHAREGYGDDPEYVRQYREGMAAIEDAAKGIGLPYATDDYKMCEELMADYSAEWVVAAIKRAQDRNRNWGTVKGILQSWKKKGGIDSPRPEEPARPSDGLTDEERDLRRRGLM